MSICGLCIRHFRVQCRPIGLRILALNIYRGRLVILTNLEDDLMFCFLLVTLFNRY